MERFCVRSRPGHYHILNSYLVLSLYPVRTVLHLCLIIQIINIFYGILRLFFNGLLRKATKLISDIFCV